jgi:outer membrane protein TolC
MFRIPVRIAPVVILSAVFLSALRAEDAPATPPPASAPLNSYGPPLTLEQCVAEALAKNFSVRIQSFAVTEAKDSVIIAQSAYDPTLGVTWQKSVSQSPRATNSTNTAALGAAPYSDNQSTTLSLTQPVITGGTVTADYGLSRFASNSIQSLLNPAYDGQISLNVSQPLLQGAGSDYGRATIQIAEYGGKIARQNFKSTVLTMVLNVESQYFNVIFARRQYEVQLDSLKLAQELLDENTAKRKAGVLTDVDVVTAESNVATAKSQLIGFKQAMQNAEDDLLETLGETKFRTPVGSVDFPPLPSTDVSFDISYKLARDNGPNLAVIDYTIEQYKLDALRAKRNNLPQLNATGGIGRSSSTTAYSYANSGVWTWAGPGYNWSAGLAFSMPWGMRANRALYRQAMTNIESEQAMMDQADQALTVQVRAAIRAVQANVEAVTAGKESVVLSQKEYDLQNEEFKAGLSTSLNVLQAQYNLESSRTSEIQAEVNLRTSLANLRFLEGTSLPNYHINLD